MQIKAQRAEEDFVLAALLVGGIVKLCNLGAS
jgi:hypothetical protein